MPMVRSPTSDAVNRGSDDSNNIELLQCDKCHVVINELLAFICNKVDTLPETGIIQVCLSSYTHEEIEHARFVAGKLLAPNKKYLRRKEGTEQRNIQEMIKLIKEFEPDCLPIFVAKNLNKLPPVSFDHIDVSTFLKDITLLKRDVECIKTKKLADEKGTDAALSTELELVKEEIRDIKKMLSEKRNSQLYATCVQEDPLLRSYHNDKNTRNELNKDCTTLAVVGSTEAIPETIRNTNVGRRWERVARGASTSTRTRTPPQPEPVCDAVDTNTTITLSRQQLTAVNDTHYVHKPTHRDIMQTTSASTKDAHKLTDEHSVLFIFIDVQKCQIMTYLNKSV